LGIEEPVELRLWTRGSIDALNGLDLKQASRWTLESMLIELSCLEGNLAMVNKQLGKLAKDQRHRGIVDCLQTVPGVGPVVASTFRFELFKPERFNRAQEVAGYLGLAPTVRQSGEGKNHGRLRPAGQERLRSLLIEAAWTWRAKDPWAGRTYRKLLSRCGIAQKAIVALARKLAIILWRLCLEKRPYYLKTVEA
jgi:transposase